MELVLPASGRVLARAPSDRAICELVGLWNRTLVGHVGPALRALLSTDLCRRANEEAGHGTVQTFGGVEGAAARRVLLVGGAADETVNGPRGEAQGVVAQPSVEEIAASKAADA